MRKNCLVEADPNAGLPFLVQVQGLPNLLHELCHLSFCSQLRPDYGTDFSRIPFDLEQESARNLLFEELACCWLSSCWHPGSKHEAENWFSRANRKSNTGFFGFEDNPETFLIETSRLLHREVVTAQKVYQLGQEQFQKSLREQDASLSPRHPQPFFAYWNQAVSHTPIIPTK